MTCLPEILNEQGNTKRNSSRYFLRANDGITVGVLVQAAYIVCLVLYDEHMDFFL
jgi:hypothetical protein